MKKDCILFFILIWTLLMVSCDPYRELKISNFEGVISLPCGEVAIRAKVMGRTLFSIDLKGNLSGELWIDPDSLEIIYKSNSIDFGLWDMDPNGKRIDFFPDDKRIRKKTPIIGESHVTLDFSTHALPPTSIGDTIFIVASGFLYCDEKNILPDTISIIIDK